MVNEMFVLVYGDFVCFALWLIGISTAEKAILLHQLVRLFVWGGKLTISSRMMGLLFRDRNSSVNGSGK